MSAAKLESLGDGRFRVIGAMNFETAAELLRESETHFSDQPTLELDLRQVTESDSAGLALIIEWMKLARRSQRPIRLVEIPGQLLALARISEVDDLLTGEEAAPVSQDPQAHREEATG